MDKNDKKHYHKRTHRPCKARKKSPEQRHSLAFRSARITAKDPSLTNSATDETDKQSPPDVPVVIHPRITHVRNGWQDPRLTSIGTYYPLGPCHRRLPHNRLSSVLSTIVDLFRILSIHVVYKESPIQASCESMDQVEFEVNVLAGRTDPSEIVIEIERRGGDVFSFHRYAQRITCALDGVEPSQDSGQAVPPCFWNRKLVELADTIVPTEVEYESHIAEAFKISWDLISNDRYDARRLGLESLIQITDPNKSSYKVAKAASKCLLLPKDGEEERVSRRIFEFVCNGDEPSSRNVDGSCLGSDSEFSYMALIVASQTFEIASQSKSIHVESFLHACPCDLVECILLKMQDFREHPHVCYYAVQSMLALCDCVPSLRSRVCSRDVEEAQLFGDSCHLALATVSQKLSLALQV